MTRKDWWLGVALVLIAIALGFAIQTAILLNEIRALNEPRIRPLVSALGL